VTVNFVPWALTPRAVPTRGPTGRATFALCGLADCFVPVAGWLDVAPVVVAPVFDPDPDDPQPTTAETPTIDRIAAIWLLERTCRSLVVCLKINLGVWRRLDVPGATRRPPTCHQQAHGHRATPDHAQPLASHSS
jgi:hypothetical protein